MTDTIPGRDKKVNWHPFTKIGEHNPLHIVSGAGALLFDFEGKKYIDAFSSWWVNLHGHGNSQIAKAIFEQAKKLEQTAFSDFTHTPAVVLSERLLSLLPLNQDKIFYSDNGSTSVEVAIKIALQYHKNLGK